MLVAAAVVPTPPLLVPEIGGGSAAADDGLRQACRAAVSRMLDATPEQVVVVGAAPTGGPAEGSWDWRGFGVQVPSPAPSERLPLALAIGSWLLDTHPGPTPPRRHVAVTAAHTATECADIGRGLVEGPARVGLLICGDGSACRDEKAPGYFDPDAAPWDDLALAALRAADAEALLALDQKLAVRLLAAGRAPWQVLAGAAGDAAFESRVTWADAPYGVMYIAGSWSRTDLSERAGSAS
ncbi:MAG: hypothetical protein JWO88_2543 [Frankiales bacterium]|nr:hypothetical protein [Frankiales bacterium]